MVKLLRLLVRIEPIGCFLLLSKVLGFLLHFHYTKSRQDKHCYVENNYQ